jgi:hypothetical protein
MKLRGDILMQLHDSIDNAIINAKRLRDENDLMRATLRNAGNQFAAYEEYHLAKQPPDYEKAAVNGDWARACHKAALEGVS